MTKSKTIEAFTQAEATAAAVERRCPWLDLDEAESSLALEDFLSFKLTRLAAGVQRGLTRHYTQHYGVGTPEWRMLGALMHFSPMSFTDLLRLSGYDKGLISRTLVKMKKKGLVKVASDPHHKKKVNILIMPPGRAVYRQILPEARRRQVRMLGVLSKQERKSLFVTLAKLQAYMARDFPD